MQTKACALNVDTPPVCVCGVCLSQAHSTKKRLCVHRAPNSKNSSRCCRSSRHPLSHRGPLTWCRSHYSPTATSPPVTYTSWIIHLDSPHPDESLGAFDMDGWPCPHSKAPGGGASFFSHSLSLLGETPSLMPVVKLVKAVLTIWSDVTVKGQLQSPIDANAALVIMTTDHRLQGFPFSFVVLKHLCLFSFWPWIYWCHTLKYLEATVKRIRELGNEVILCGMAFAVVGTTIRLAQTLLANLCIEPRHFVYIREVLRCTNKQKCLQKYIGSPETYPRGGFMQYYPSSRVRLIESWVKK